MNFSSALKILTIVSIFLFNSKSFGWGAKGHDVIAKLAAEVFDTKYEKEAADFGRILKSKSELLGHLANVPDVYWKSLPRDITEVLNPAHYVDMEYLSNDPVMKTFPKELSEFLTYARKLCESSGLAKRLDCEKASDLQILKTTGTAQFRIRQLTTMMKNELVNLKHKQDNPTKTKGSTDTEKDYVDRSLLYAGLLAHFVGDLGQPFHSSVDYDGWLVNQGGIHAYFEVDLVNVLSNSWEDEVLKYAVDFNPAKNIVSEIEKNKGAKVDYLNIAISLGIDSLDEKNRVLMLDRTHAMIKSSKSKGSGLKSKAKRKKSRDTVVYFKQVLKERFAASSDVLAYLWLKAYKDAGSPNVKKYKSYYYPLKPEPIPLDYL
jgi:hypothetical protein